MSHGLILHTINETALLKGFHGVITPAHLSQLEDKLAEEAEKSRACIKANDHKDQYSNPYAREVDRLQTIIAFVKTGVSVERTGGGLITVNGKYIVSLANPRWRVKGKNTWYWYKTPEDFVERYVNK